MPVGKNQRKEGLPAFSEEPLGNEMVVTEYDDGSVDYDFDVENFEEATVPEDEDFYDNLAEYLDEDYLDELASKVIDQVEADQQSSKEHLNTITQGISLLGVNLEETDDPFPGACAAHHPLIIESAVKFQAKASHELFGAKGPVKTAIIGKSDEEKDAQALRVKNHMNWQLMFQMEEYFDETEMMLFYLPIHGSAFKKLYFDETLGRPAATFVPIDHFVVNYFASNLKTASSFTHIIPRTENDLKKDMVAGLYREIELGQPTMAEETEHQQKVNEIMGVSPSSEDESYTLYEQYRFVDLPEPYNDPDGVALPYIVTVDKDTPKVLSIRRGWHEGDPKKERYCPFTHYKFVPGMGFYGLGYLHLLGNLQITLTTTMRSLVDAGQFSNLQAGFVDKRLRIRKNDGPLAPGELKEVEAGGIPLKDAIMMLPFKEPSNVLFQMLQFLEGRGQKFADSTEQVISDSTNYGPVGTTMALLEASTKFFTGVHKRLHKAQKHEFSNLAELNFLYLDDVQEFDTYGGTFEVRAEDYDGRVDVIPVSDPNISSSSQRMALAQTQLQAALQAPHEHNIKEAYKRFYEAMNVEDIEELLPPDEQARPADPVTDILKAQKGEPIAAFSGQDHDAHIAVKQAFLNDPTTGGSPLAQQIAPVLIANIQEHLIHKFQEQVAGAMTRQDPETDPQVQEQIIAQAAQQVSENNRIIAEAKEQGGLVDPKALIAQAELINARTRSKEVDADIELDQADQSIKYMDTLIKKFQAEQKAAMDALKLENQKTQSQLDRIVEFVEMQLKTSEIPNNES